MGGISSALFSSSFQQHLKDKWQCYDVKYSSTRQMLNEFFGIPHAPIHAKATCCQGALNQTGQEIDSVAKVRVSALFHAVHTLARFVTKHMNFGVKLADHGISERRTSPEMVYTSLVACVWLHFSDRFMCKGVDIKIQMCCSQGDGFNTSLSRFMYCTHASLPTSFECVLERECKRLCLLCVVIFRGTVMCHPGRQ